jgi:hypothetical protein
MLASAVSTDLPAQCSSVSHCSGEMNAEVFRFAKLFRAKLLSVSARVLLAGEFGTHII